MLKFINRCVTIDAWVVLRNILYSLLQITYLNCFLKLILYSLLRIYTLVTSPESWCREDSTKVCLRVVVLGIYYKIILEVVTRIATGMFQQGLSLGSFKNSFVGDFGALSLNPSHRLIATHPHYNLMNRYLIHFPLQF